MTADGKGIVSNDPASGKQVVLSYDGATETVGGVTSVSTRARRVLFLAEAGEAKTATAPAG